MTISSPNTPETPDPSAASRRRGRGPGLVLVEETAVWLEVNGQPAVTWMCTPAMLEELAIGWLHGEGYIRTRHDLRSLRNRLSEWYSDSRYRETTSSHDARRIRAG